MATLELTERQEKVLLVILSRVGGDPKKTLRGETNPILRVLLERHYDWYEATCARIDYSTRKKIPSKQAELFDPQWDNRMWFADGKDLPDAR